MIRPAASDDLAAITEIYADAVLHGTASFETVPPDLPEMTRRFEALTAAGYPYLVASVGTGIAGYAYAGPYRSRAAYRFTVENSVYVDSKWQGKGIGRALLRALISASEEAGFRQMIAVIGDSRNTASIALHETADFRMIGTHVGVGRKHGQWLDTVEMQKALGTGHHDDPLFEPS